MTRKYSDEEVDAILRRALQKDDGIAHDELVAAAAEIGISPEDIERAATELDSDSNQAAAVDAIKKKRKRKFVSHFTTYALVSLFLVAVDFFSGGGMWAHWPIMSWGLFVALEGARLFQEPEPPKPQKKSRKERRREQAIARRLERKQRKEKLAGAQQRFEKAVDEGVSALLEHVASRIEQSANKGSARAKGEFADYVRKKSGQGVSDPQSAGSKSGGASKRKAKAADVRVEVPDLEAEYSEEELREAARELEESLS